ncbi:MAG TPA: 50S ribosomal protein L22, partial [Candidatus Acidoferrum sp.]|nr:50S ribosomal protein L22 [Candidatus Acidoferrum sp.]
MTIQATIKGIRQSPRKIGLVAALVRGRSVADALIILEHTPKRAAKPVAKAVASVKANAINNHRLDEKTLVIDQLQVTAGPRLKRMRAAAMGRGLAYQKKTSHITIAVSGTEKP